MIQLTSAYSTDLRRYQPAAILLWTLLILAMYGVDTYKRLESTKKMALDQARAYINKDLALRTWAADQGGIYVPVSKTVLPNPYLSMVQDRDLTTPGGVKLTLVNPAYLMRLVGEHQARLYGVRGHLTSLNLLNHENAPEDWEREALKNFEAGEREFISNGEENGK